MNLEFSEDYYLQNMGNAESSPTPTLPEYEYNPLPGPRHIRLLKIQYNPPSTYGVWKPKVSIHTKSLDELGDGKLSFNALSYTWALPLRDANEPNAGGEAPASCGSQHEIEINSRSLIVSQNLYDALGRMNGLANLIWIDAICINQKDLAERASQVLLMDDIYSKASRVIAWLGKDESDAQETLLVLTHVNTLMKNYWDTGRFHPDRDRFMDPGFLQRINFNLPMDEWIRLWDAFSRFFRRRRYFDRGWILQELALTRHILMLCGRHELPWDKMCELCAFLSKSGFEMELSSRVMTMGNFQVARPPVRTGGEMMRLSMFQQAHEFYWCEQMLRDNPDIRVTMRANDPHWDGQMPQPPVVQSIRKLARDAMCAKTPRQRWFAHLCYMVFRVRECQLTDKKDNIYAILGLVKKAMPLETPEPFPVQVDYTASVEDVYKSITTMFIREVPVLTVLSLVEDIAFRTTYPGLPSWVPNYSYPFCPTPYAWLGVGGYYNASRIAEGRQSRHSFDGNALTLYGRKFSTIHRVCTPQREMIRSRWLPPCFNLCSDLPQPYFHLSGQSKLEILWRTMTANHGPTDVRSGMGSISPAPPEVGTSFKACLKFWLAEALCKEPHGSESFGDFIITHHKLKTLTTEPSLGDVRALVERMRNARTPFAYNAIAVEANRQMSAFATPYEATAQHRRLYLTEDQQLGLGPQSAEVGDEVWLVDGAQVPFILRPVAGKEQTFTLVGETYVHGFMNGEMLDWKGTGEEKEIRIM
jgi:hypothetical protein